MRLKLTPSLLGWFEDRNISFDQRFRPRLTEKDFIHFGQDLVLEHYVGFHGGTSLCSMGFMSYTNSPVPWDMKVGRYCSIGPNVLFGGYRHPIEHVSTSVFTHDTRTDLVVRFLRDDRPGYENFYPNPQRKSITIDNDVWIGRGATIMPGVVLGTGCVVASMSVVTKSVEPYEIVGGNPARRLRMRFSDGIVQALISSEWFRYKFTDFHDLDLSQPEKFLHGFEARKREIEPFQTPLVTAQDLVEAGA